MQTAILYEDGFDDSLNNPGITPGCLGSFFYPTVISGTPSVT